MPSSIRPSTPLKPALPPVFDGGAYHLTEADISLLAEVSFKLGILAIGIIDGDLIADQL